MSNAILFKTACAGARARVCVCVCFKGMILVLAEISEEFKLPVNCLCDSPTAISFFEVGW